MKSGTSNQSTSKRGGARPGAGRKRKRDLLAGPIEQLREAIEEIAPDVGPALRDLVTGVYREEVTADGTVRVYRQPPNLGAIQEVLNRTLGKPSQAIELSGDLTPDDGFSALILGDSAVRELAQALFAAMGARGAGGGGLVRKRSELGVGSPPDPLDVPRGIAAR
jgi:hypothetical protein